MTAAARLLPDNTNGTPPYDAITWQAKANLEVMALWRYAGYPLTGVSGTNAILAASDTTVVTAITAYQTGMKRSLIPAVTNTGGVTINIDSVGVVNLKDADGATLTGGALVAGRMYGIEYDGTAFRVVAGGTNAAAFAYTTAPDAIFRDEKTTGTNGGAATSGSFAKRTLNTSTRNTIAGCSLSASQITLQAGTYYFEWSAPAFYVANFLTRLFNATDATTVETGTPEYSSNSGTGYNGVATRSIGCAVVTITSAKAFEIDQIVAASSASGLGAASNLGAKEVYTEVRVWKVGTLASQVNGVPGGGVTFPVLFSTTTADADPGAGTLRLNNATQSSATSAFVDLLDANGIDITTLLDNIIVGALRLVKYDDPTKFLVFGISAWTTASGYRKYTISNLGPTGSPFANGDRLFFAATVLSPLPKIIGSTAAGGKLTLQSTSNGSPSGDSVVLNVGGVDKVIANSTGLAVGPALAPDSAMTVNSNTAATDAPASGTILHLVGPDTTFCIIEFDTFGTDRASSFEARCAGGTLASKAALPAGELFNITTRAWDGSTYAANAQIRIFADQLQSGTDHSTHIRVRVTPVGSTTLTEALRIAADSSLVHRANATTVVDTNSHLGLRSYTVATLPSAATAARAIYVSDGTSNKRFAVSDGANWRWPDGAIVS